METKIIGLSETPREVFEFEVRHKGKKVACNKLELPFDEKGYIYLEG